MNFGEHNCPLSGQFWGSLEAKRGQNAHFCAPGKTLIVSVVGRWVKRTRRENISLNYNLVGGWSSHALIYQSKCLSC